MPNRFVVIATVVTCAFTLLLTSSQSHAAGIPSATTGNSTNITSSSATVGGVVNPNGATTTGYFELGATTNYGTSTTTFNAGSGSNPVLASADFLGLLPNTLYHYRIVAMNSFGTN